MNYFKKLINTAGVERFLTVLTACLCTVLSFRFLVIFNNGIIRMNGNLELFKFMAAWTLMGIILYYIIRLIALLITYLIVTIKNKFVKQKEELK